MISEEEPGDEEAPYKLVTSLCPDLLLVEGDEDDGVLEVTARLGEGAGRLEHGYHTWHTDMTDWDLEIRTIVTHYDSNEQDANRFPQK